METVNRAIAQAIDPNAQEYNRKHVEINVTVDRRRTFITVSPSVQQVLPELR